MTTYYAITNVNGPISVRLDAPADGSIDDLLRMIPSDAIDGCRTDAEDDLDIALDDPQASGSTERVEQAIEGAGFDFVYRGDESPRWSLYRERT